jgi:hypothetical protein
MKKIIAMFLVLVTLLLVCSCGNSESGNSESGDKRIELSVDNINQYINLSTEIKDCTVNKDSGSIHGVSYVDYSGNATVKVSAVNQSGAKFENVTITCEIYTFVNSHPIPYGWEFNYGNKNTGKTNLDKNSKTITISLPYDGNWSDTEALTLKLYGQLNYFMPDPSKLYGCYIKILNVSGTAIGGTPNQTTTKQTEGTIILPSNPH